MDGRLMVQPLLALFENKTSAALKRVLHTSRGFEYVVLSFVIVMSPDNIVWHSH